jgi:hypothetical protein
MMSKAVTLLTVFCLTGFATADDLRVSSTEQVVVTAPDQWKSEKDKSPTDALAVETYRVAPKGDRNVILMISILKGEQQKTSDPEALKILFRLGCRPYVASAADLPKVELKELKIDGGRGYYANFTDPDLVGKPVKKGSYKTATPMVLSLSSKYLITVTLLCDDLNGNDYKDAFKIAESIRIKKE